MTMGREITPEVATPKALEGRGEGEGWEHQLYLAIFASFFSLKGQEICGSPIVL